MDMATEWADWKAEKKIALIKSMNPEWKDLSEEWFVDGHVILSEAKNH